MKIQVFNRFKPSEHFDITIFGVTLFEFMVSKWYEERTIAFTLIGIKLQVTYEKSAK